MCQTITPHHQLHGWNAPYCQKKPFYGHSCATSAMLPPVYYEEENTEREYHVNREAYVCPTKPIVGSPAQLQLPSFTQLMTYVKSSCAESTSQDGTSSYTHTSSASSPLVSNNITELSTPMSISPLPKLSSYVPCVNTSSLSCSPSRCHGIIHEDAKQSLPSIQEMLYLKRQSSSIPLIKRKIMRMEKRLPFSASNESINKMTETVSSTTFQMLRPSSSTNIAAVITKNKKSLKQSTGTKCRHANCVKKAKAGGFCICHGGGLRCSVENCTKHAVTMGLCIRHGGGKRCIAEGCHNAARKNNVCWSHGGKKLCKKQGCPNGTKIGGYCWTHRYLRKPPEPKN